MGIDELPFEEQIDHIRTRRDFISSSGLEALRKRLRDFESPETLEHCSAVAEMVIRLARIMGETDERTLEGYRIGAELHDIGKTDPDLKPLLHKSDSLGSEEKTTLSAHSLSGRKLLSDYAVSRIDTVVIVIYHHERFDGKGYPEGLKGENIPLPARLFSVIDALDAMLGDRSYHRGGKPRSYVESELRANAGSQFDPKIVDIVLQNFDSITDGINFHNRIEPAK